MKIKTAARIFLPPLWRFLRKTQGGVGIYRLCAPLSPKGKAREGRNIRRNFKQTSIGGFAATLPEGESKGRANKLRHLIEKIRIENKMRPSPPPLGGASPPRGSLDVRKGFPFLPKKMKFAEFFFRQGEAYETGGQLLSSLGSAALASLFAGCRKEVISFCRICGGRYSRLSRQFPPSAVWLPQRRRGRRLRRHSLPRCRKRRRRNNAS